MTSPDAACLISVSGLTKRFGDFTALRDVHLDLHAGQVRGLCGGNGAGKSTLVKLLTGVLQPSAGTIAIGGAPAVLRNPVEGQRRGVALVAQELSLAPDLSLHDNLWLGHAKAGFWRSSSSARERSRRALAEVGLDPGRLDAPVRRLGLGERQLVEIARGLVREVRILILDEPTATLSDREIETVFAAIRRLKARGRSVLFITHRLGEVAEICDTLTVLRNGEVVASADVGDVPRSDLIELILGQRLQALFPKSHSPPGTLLLDVTGLTVPGIVDGLALQCHAGEIVALAGQIGSGALDALRAMAGLEPEANGSMTIAGRVVPLGSPPRAASAGLRFVSEDRAAEGVFLRADASRNLTATRIATEATFGLLGRRGLRAVARHLATGVGFEPRRLLARADRLSGGNQQKLAVGRCAGLTAPGSRPGVLLLNEPTRGVDTGARAEIYRLLRRFCADGFGVVLASTDMEEVLGLADRVVTMHRGRAVATYRRAAFDEATILADMTHPVPAS